MYGRPGASGEHENIRSPCGRSTVASCTYRMWSLGGVRVVVVVVVVVVVIVVVVVVVIVNVIDQLH